jgi:H+/gluconate symporter-like permease
MEDKNMRKQLLAGVLAVALAAIVGIFTASVSAQPEPQTFSVAVHIEYPDGFVYDHAFVTGVPASDLPSFLAACGKGHLGGSGVRYHCYAIPE